MPWRACSVPSWQGVLTAGEPPRRQAGCPTSQDSIWSIRSGTPGIAAARAPPGRAAATARQRSGRYRSCAAARGQLLQRGGLELADVLAAGAEFGDEAVVRQ